MKVRLNAYSFMQSLRNKEAQDFFWTVENIKEPKEVLKAIQSGSFEFIVTEGL